MRVSDSPYVSVLPKVEPVYWTLRSFSILGLVYHMVVSSPPMVTNPIWWGVAAGFLALTGIPAYLVRLRTLKFERIFWPLFAADMLAIAYLVYHTGGIDSNFFVLFYALVPFVGYYSGMHAGLAAAAGVTVVYAVPCFMRGGVEVLPAFIFRMVLMWVLTSAMGVASNVFKLFAQRLINAMDKLNERTSEVERTHFQLQKIYETSRSLAELMPVDNVVDRILAIARQVLHYPVCEVYTWDVVNKKLWLKGRINQELTERLDRPMPVEPGEAFRRVIHDGQIVRITDRHMGKPIIDGYPYRSQIVVPMISEGRLYGLLSAESPSANAFSERDENVLSILSASAAMSLVNADLHQQMEKLTIIDELTGVYNFRHFRSRLEDEERRAARYGTPLSLIMVDIDWFKGLNDQFGHQVGNVALRQLARVIGTCVRDVDVSARYGGEEFIIILPQTATDEAKRIGDRIRERVEQADFGPDGNGHPIKLTVSVGISCYPDNGLPEENLVESVDQALYRAKGAGKNKVVTV